MSRLQKLGKDFRIFFIKQIITDSLQCCFRSVTFCSFGFSSWNNSNMAPRTC